MTKAIATNIVNISKLTTKRIRETLEENGIEVKKGTKRAGLIILARKSGLWTYSGNVVGKDFKSGYGASQSCDDDVAAALADFVRVPNATGKGSHIAEDVLEAVADVNGIKLKRWSHLNIGMQRMNLGNVLRGMVKRGEKVIIGSETFEARDPEVEAAL